jgi:mono/diheme cytochrome c family protein
MRGAEIFAAVLVAGAISGCDWMPGKPDPAKRWQPPSAVSDFSTLYAQNCLGCHGDGNSVAGSITLRNPVYLQILPEEVLRDAISKGIPGTNMPAFGSALGGELTDAQIDILVKGILAWRSPSALPTDPIPPYAGPVGSAAAGASVFNQSCAACHGQDGAGGEKAGSVVDPTYLGLVSDQYLRTVVIAGRPELGCPDFAHRTEGRAMTAGEVSDVVAWLASHRRNEYGQPIAPTKP